MAPVDPAKHPCLRCGKPCPRVGSWCFKCYKVGRRKKGTQRKVPMRGRKCYREADWPAFYGSVALELLEPTYGPAYE